MLVSAMPSFFTRMLRFALVAGVMMSSGSLILSEASAAPAKLEYRTVRGQEYITLRSIKNFYAFSSMRREGGKVILENSKYRLVFHVGQQVVLMNGVKFIFSSPVRQVDGRYLVHEIDVAKLVDPVMRPQNAQGAGVFDTIIIDPGHGGVDSGAPGPYQSEAYYTLKLAKELKVMLEKLNYKVVLTRNTDRNVSKPQRVAIANRYPKAIFISLHFNSGGGGRATGIETFTLSPRGVAHYGRGVKSSDALMRQGNAQDAANIVLATAIHQTTVDKTRAFDRGIKRARWSVLTGLKHPGILFEGGFLNNASDARKINNSKYLRVMAASIAHGIQLYRMAVTKRR